MKTLDAAAPGFSHQLAALLTRDSEAADVTAVVADIINDVRTGGDAAVRDYTRRFDRHTLDTLLVPASLRQQLAAVCPPEVQEALAFAARRIRQFHEQQQPAAVQHNDEHGVRCGMQWRAMDSAGLYVPGGRASYPSSVLMNAIPAQVAGVQRLALCVPMPGGEGNPAVFAAAELLGIDEIYAVGGAQAVAALAYGTQTIAAVDKIVGPGNAYVAEAKRQVFGRVGIDSIAGPSEVLIVADSSANARWLAWDMLAQAEHDPDAQSILITDDTSLAGQVTDAIAALLDTLPTAASARQSINRHAAIIMVGHLADAMPLVNRIAPEHLQLCVHNAATWLPEVRHAGSVFIGHHTPEALGDYLAGPNHVLPTMGTARFASGLSVYDFVKRTTWLECPEAAYPLLARHAAVLADSEGLEAHAGSVRARLGSNAP